MRYLILVRMVMNKKMKITNLGWGPEFRERPSAGNVNGLVVTEKSGSSEDSGSRNLGDLASFLLYNWSQYVEAIPTLPNLLQSCP